MIVVWSLILFIFQFLRVLSLQDEEALANLKMFNDMWAKMKAGKQWSSSIPYADIKAYTDLTIPDIAPMYDASIKSFVFKYFVDEELETYKKYLFQRVIDEWFLHVPCYTMRDLGATQPIKCPPSGSVSDKMKGMFEGSVCIGTGFGCNMYFNKPYKMYVISLDDLRKCGPGKVHAFVAKALGARSPVQEPDRNEHVTVNFENVEIGMSERYFSNDKWRDEFPILLEDLDYCRKTTEEVYTMKTAVFKTGIFDYGSVLVPETFQYSDPLDPRPVTVTKEIYEQVRLDRSKYGSDFRLRLTGNDLYRMRLFFGCGSNSKCFKKDGVCKNMGFIASSPRFDAAGHKDETVTCDCFCPYADLKGQFCERNEFMKYKYLNSKAMCFDYIKKEGTIKIEKLLGRLVAERGHNVLTPKGKQTYSYRESDIFSDVEARQITHKQDALVAMFSPPADIRTHGGLAAAPDVWVTKQWCTFIWAPPAKKRAIVTIDPKNLWKSKEFTERLPEVTKSLVELRGDCQRALKFVHAHGPDGSKLRVKCFSVIYFSPDRPYTIYSNTTRLSAYIYWDWYLSQGVPRQLKLALNLTMKTVFASAHSFVLGAKPLKPLPPIHERPDPPQVKGTTEYWMNPKYPMDDFFASIRNNNTKKIVLIVLAVIFCLALLGGAGFLLYYFMVIKPRKENAGNEDGYDQGETNYNTPANEAADGKAD